MKEIPPYPDGTPFRYNGFTCPKCGGHFYNTFLNRKIPQRGTGVDDPADGAKMIRPEFPNNVRVGACSNFTVCGYFWERSKDVSLGVMNVLPFGEWLKHRAEVRRRRKEGIPY